MTILKSIAVLVLFLCAIPLALASEAGISFVGSRGAKIVNTDAFKKKPSVLPAGARLVAGNAQRNEFYILGKMDMQPETEKDAPPKATHVLQTKKHAHHASHVSKHKVHHAVLISKHKSHAIKLVSKHKAVRIARAK